MYDTLLACAELAEKEEINLNLEALNITTDRRQLPRYHPDGR